MATSVLSSLQQISYLQQKRKISFQDYGFEEAKNVKRIRIRYTPPLVSFTKELRCNNNREAEKPVIIKIKCTPSSVKTPPPPPPSVIRNTEESMTYNQRENKRLLQLSRMLGNTIRHTLFTDRKLCLVIDLDHTLLHSVRIQDVSADEQEYLNLRVSSDMEGNNLYKPKGRYTKLRPYTREFLKKASGMFKLFLYTMGTRDYAREMGRLLDSDGVLFRNNIVSKDDSTIANRKNLDVLAGPNEKNTIIIDDTKHVWENNRDNLIRIDKYKYFTDEKLCHKLKKNDREGFGEEDEALNSILEVLQDVHKKFFDMFPTVPQTRLQEYITSVDVRPVLKPSVKKFKKSQKKSSKGAVNC